MSIEICYAKNFIRTSRGIIPEVLMGSSNCTMYYGRKEILERNWFPLEERMIEKTPEEILAIVDEEMTNMSTRPYAEMFKFAGKFVGYGKDCVSYRKWMENGIKAAHTLEEYGKTVWCAVDVYEQNSLNFNRSLETYCKTTKELEDWLDKATAFKTGLIDNKVYTRIDFGTIKGIPVKSGINGQVIAKLNNGYVYDYKTGKSASSSPNISEAIVFDSVEDAMGKLGTRWTGLKFIKAENKNKKSGDFVIATNRGYIYKLSRSRMHFTQYPKNAKRFASEKEAERYIKEHHLSERWSEDRVGKYTIINSKKGDLK